jgi:hypothetical protein
MTPARTQCKRPYLASGMYRRQPPSPEVQQAMAELRAQLVADKGGRNIKPNAKPSDLVERGLNEALLDSIVKPLAGVEPATYWY